jgi:hypothetical protein
MGRILHAMNIPVVHSEYSNTYRVVELWYHEFPAFIFFTFLTFSRDNVFCGIATLSVSFRPFRRAIVFADTAGIPLSHEKGKKDKKKRQKLHFIYLVRNIRKIRKNQKLRFIYLVGNNGNNRN